MAAKVGDTIEVVSTNGYTTLFRVGELMTVRCLGTHGSVYVLNGEKGDGCECGKHSWVLRTGDYKVIKNSKNMDLQKSFSMLFKDEPEKTFIKVGLMNDNGTFTSEGEAIFLQFLVKKHGAEFKTEVADKLLEEQKKD